MNIGRLDCEVDGMRTTQFVAIGDGREGEYVSILGGVELLVWKPNQKEWAPRRSACIRMLFVHRAFRMEGIGRRLVEKACDLARELGCETLGLSLAADNYSGSEFYKKLGFDFAYEYDDGSFIVSKNLQSKIENRESKIPR